MEETKAPKLTKKPPPAARKVVQENFPIPEADDPTIATMINTLALLTKAALALACSELLPAGYPSKRAAERTADVDTLRKDLSTLIGAVCLGHKTERETTEPNVSALLAMARAWAREIEIQRIEAKAKAAIERENVKTDAKFGNEKTQTTDGRLLSPSELQAEVIHTADKLVRNHEEIHGRKASIHERRQAVRVAAHEIVGMTPITHKLLSRAEAKRARKALRRLAGVRSHEVEASIG